LLCILRQFHHMASQPLSLIQAIANASQEVESQKRFAFYQVRERRSECVVR
jgi:hypothetical protein